MTQPQSQLIARLQQPDVSALDDAGAATAIQNDFRTARDILLPALRSWISNNGLASRIRRTLDSPVFSAVVSGAKVDPIRTFDSVIDALNFINTGGSASLSTSDPTPDETGQTIGQKTYSLLMLMVMCNQQDATIGCTATEMQNNPPTTPPKAFLDFGGGIVWGPGSVAAVDVTAARAVMAASASRAAAIASIAQRVTNVLADWSNEKLNPASADSSLAVPTWDDFLTIVNAA